MHHPNSSQRPPSGGSCPETRPQRATGPLGGQATGGRYDGINPYDGMVVGHTPAHGALRGRFTSPRYSSSPYHDY